MVEAAKHYKHKNPWFSKCGFCHNQFDIHVKGSMRVGLRKFLREGWVEVYVCVECAKKYNLDKLWRTLTFDPLFNPANFLLDSD